MHSVFHRMIRLTLPVLLLSSSLEANAQNYGQGFGQGFGQSIQQGFGQTHDSALENPTFDKKPLALPTKEKTLEDFFPKTDTDFPVPPLYPMKGVAVPGLDAKSVSLLSQFHMVVSDNPPYTSMSQIYRNNRLKGKSSFVTADCIVHPYFAINNKILRDVIYEKVMPGLPLMLKSMLTVAVADYKNTDDPEVKNDISKNIAYILVALRLLDPDGKLPSLGAPNEIADAELVKIARGKTARSAIYGSEEDYAFFRPNGFYERETKLRNFFRCRQWLSRIQFPLADNEIIDARHQDQAESRFRQSVLLYRCLDQATVNGAPAMDYWTKYYKVWLLMGAKENSKDRPLLATDYKTVFKTTNVDFRNLIKDLSQPFFRTKLLLSIRKNKPVELNSASILTMRKEESHQVELAAFRFMPITDEPEVPWFSDLAQKFSDDRNSTEATPFALLELYARGSTIATNVLNGITWKLNSELFDELPRLVDATGRKRAQAGAALDAGSLDGRWGILSHYFKVDPESTTQPALKSDQWVRRRLFSAAAGWVDSHVALISAETPVANGDAPLVVPPDSKSVDADAADAALPVPKKALVSSTTAKTAVVTLAANAPATPAAPPSKPASTTAAASSPPASASSKSAPSIVSTNKIASTTPPASKATAATTGGISVNHEVSGIDATASQTAPTTASHGPITNYLDPSIFIYKNLRLKMQQTLDDLNSIDYLPAESKKMAQDFIYLCQKLEEIAKKEVSNNQIAREDSRFLGAIDEQLDKFPAPTEAVWHLESHTVLDKKGKNTSGANLCIGRPGEIFILLNVGRGKTLSRGAVYTYYEIAGGAIKPETLEQKLSKGTVPMPTWTRDFEAQQENPAK
jgi:Protein of unknown function (DUF3160)